MIETLNLNDMPTRDTMPRARVFVRARWADAWVERPNLAPASVVWSAYPEVSTASLIYRYGFVTTPGRSATELFAPIDTRGYYVCIVTPADDVVGDLFWLGFAESAVTTEHIAATATTPATGMQTIPCFGMERVWDYALIQGTTGDGYRPPGNLWRPFGNVAATFNNDPRGNRTALKKPLDTVRNSTAYGFAQPTDPTRRPWSSQTIIEYLLRFWAPTQSRIIPNANSDPAVEIPWRISGLANVPDWDTPTVQAEGRSVGDVLRELVTPGRMTGLAVGPVATMQNDLPEITAVTLFFTSRAVDPINVPGIGTLPIAAPGVNIQCVRDPLTTLTHTVESTDIVDQIIVQGPREVSVCTLTAGATQLAPNWTAAQATKYTNGGNAHPSWANWTNTDRRAANRTIRESSDVDTVFRDLRFFGTHNGTARNGRSIFPDQVTGGNASPPAAHVAYPEGCEILADLPLVDTVNYAASLTNIDESAGRTFRRPLVTFRRPFQTNANKRLVASLVGQNESMLLGDGRGFTLSVDPDNSLGPGLRLNVLGASQLLVTSLPGNVADGVTKPTIDYTTIEATVAIRGDRRALYAIPLNVPNVDVIRRRIHVFEHRSLQLTYMAPDTVIGINNANERVTATGGILHNPLPRLRGLCELIWTHTNTPRNRVEIVTRRTLSRLPLGKIVRTIDTHGVDVRAPVVQVRIEFSDARSADDATVTQTITAASNHFDVLSALAAGGLT